MSMEKLRIPKDATFALTVDRLMNDVTKMLLSSATVVATVLDASQAEVADSGSPISLTTVSEVSGSYLGYILDTADWEIGDEGTVEYEVSVSGDPVRTFRALYVVVR